MLTASTHSSMSPGGWSSINLLHRPAHRLLDDICWLSFVSRLVFVRYDYGRYHCCPASYSAATISVYPGIFHSVGNTSWSIVVGISITAVRENFMLLMIRDVDVK